MRGPSLFAAALAASLAASCAAPTPETEAGRPGPATEASARPAASPPAPPPPEAAAATPEPAAAPRADQGPGEGAAAQAAALAPPPPPAPPPLRPAEIMGLDDGALARLLGPPGFKRIDDPAALWQYRDGSCILFVFLYADGGAYRVKHLEFRRPGDAGAIAGPEAEDCLARLRTGMAPGRG